MDGRREGWEERFYIYIIETNPIGGSYDCRGYRGVRESNRVSSSENFDANLNSVFNVSTV